MSCIHDAIAGWAYQRAGSHTNVAKQSGMAYDTYYKWRSHGKGTRVLTLQRLASVGGVSLIVFPADQLHRLPAWVLDYVVEPCHTLDDDDEVGGSNE